MRFCSKANFPVRRSEMIDSMQSKGHTPFIFDYTPMKRQGPKPNPQISLARTRIQDITTHLPRPPIPQAHSVNRYAEKQRKKRRRESSPHTPSPPTHTEKPEKRICASYHNAEPISSISIAILNHLHTHVLQYLINAIPAPQQSSAPTKAPLSTSKALVQYRYSFQC